MFPTTKGSEFCLSKCLDLLLPVTHKQKTQYAFCLCANVIYDQVVLDQKYHMVDLEVVVDYGQTHQDCP